MVVVLTGEEAGERRNAGGLHPVRLHVEKCGAGPGVSRRSAERGAAGIAKRGGNSASLLGATLRRKLEHTFVGKDGGAWDSFYFDNFFSAFGADEQAGLLTAECAREFAPQSAYTNVLAFWERSVAKEQGGW